MVGHLKHICEMGHTITCAITKAPRSQVLPSSTEDAVALSLLCIMHGVNIVTAHCDFLHCHMLETILFEGEGLGFEKWLSR